MRHALFILIVLSFLFRPFEAAHHHDEGPPGACCPHALVKRDDEWDCDCTCHKEKP